MERRRLGKTGHMSTVVTYGTVAIGSVDQETADRSIEYVLSRGINHFDVAPTYAEAELRLGSYLKRNPQPELFVSCKTNERGKAEAREELHRTLDRLGQDRFDLYQLHAVGTIADLDLVMSPGHAMEAILEAREEGLVSHIGITGHGWESAKTHAEALRRFDFATVMTSCNLFMAQDPAFKADWDTLMQLCSAQDVGVHVLKATARIAWGERSHSFGTWYEPFVERDDVSRAVAWVLNQPVTTICSAGDQALQPAIIDAAETYSEIDEAAQLSLLHVPSYGDFFVPA